jgi:trigger factor
MKHSIKQISDSQVEATASLDANDLAPHHKKAIGKLSKNLKVAGFRAGHVPAEVAEKQLNQQQLADEVVNAALNAALIDILNAEQIQPLDQPQVTITKFVPYTLIEFTANIPVLPAIKLADLKKLTTKKPEVKISDQEITEVIDRLRTNAATKSEVKRPAKLGDEVIIDFTGTRDGKEFTGGKATDFALTLGSGQFIPGFEDAIVGHKSGDKFDIPLTFPKDYGAKDLAGAKVSFAINLKKVQEIKLPELDDKFAQTVAPDLKTVDALKNDVKKELTARAEFDAKENFQNALLDELAEKSDVTAPEVLVDDQANTIEQNFTQNLAYQGLKLSDYLADKFKGDREQWVAKELRPMAEKRVKSSLVLNELEKMWNIQATDAEVIAQQQRLMGQYSEPDLKARFDNDEAKQQIARQIIADKTLAELEKRAGK